MSTKLRRITVGLIAAVCVIVPTAALAGGKQDKAQARMTGGGNVTGESLGDTVKVTHGFTLHCRTSTNPQRLQVNWSGGNSFHLTDLEDSFCRDEGFDQENPRAPIDTYYGEGTGRLNFGGGQKDTGFATWRFVDDGEPGGANANGGDELLIEVYNSDGVLIMFASGKLTKGNHQAHRGTGSKA